MYMLCKRSYNSQRTSVEVLSAHTTLMNLHHFPFPQEATLWENFAPMEPINRRGLLDTPEHSEQQSIYGS